MQRTQQGRDREGKGPEGSRRGHDQAGISVGRWSSAPPQMRPSLSRGRGDGPVFSELPVHGEALSAANSHVHMDVDRETSQGSGGDSGEKGRISADPTGWMAVLGTY